MQELLWGGIMIIMDAAGELGVMLNTNDLGGYVITDQDNLGTVWDARSWAVFWMPEAGQCSGAQNWGLSIM